jgi:hypothetical protein
MKDDQSYSGICCAMTRQEGFFCACAYFEAALKAMEAEQGGINGLQVAATIVDLLKDLGSCFQPAFVGQFHNAFQSAVDYHKKTNTWQSSGNTMECFVKNVTHLPYVIAEIAHKTVCDVFKFCENPQATTASLEPLLAELATRNARCQASPLSHPPWPVPLLCLCCLAPPPILVYFHTHSSAIS